MAAGKYNITIDAYAGFAVDIVCQDADGVAVDLTGYTARAQIRKTAQSSSILTSFVVTFTPLTGTIHLTLAATETLKLQTITDAVWDLFLVPSGEEPFKLLAGAVKISAAVTRV